MTEGRKDSFVHFLGELDPGGRATLRRSLAFAPGTWPAAFPFVEPWARNRRDWERRVLYLVAGLHALSRAPDAHGDFGVAAARLQEDSSSGSVEARFIALLDADADQLPYRLRQMVSLMSAHSIAPAWDRLRRDLDWWMHTDRVVQQRWARSFYARADANDD